MNSRGPLIKKVAGEIFRQVKDIPKDELLDTCEMLYKEDLPGESGVASIWVLKISRQYRESDFTRFEGWLKRYVDNWGGCDTFCAVFLANSSLCILPLINRWMRFISMCLATRLRCPGPH